MHPASFGKDGEVKDIDERRQKTLDLLNQLKVDGSPKALGDLPAAERVAAFAPTPTILPTSDILFDAWALTTIKDKLPGRRPVGGRFFLLCFSNDEPGTHGPRRVSPELYVAFVEGWTIESIKPSRFEVAPNLKEFTTLMLSENLGWDIFKVQ